MIRRIYFVVGLLLGFILCAHWDGGRDFVQDVSPVYTKRLKQGMEKLQEGVNKTGTNLERKFKNAIK
ncbi:MAG: hypothetical protein KAG61_00050 [Bacteriovoracaceae bacterium]|nr:hypothetical protein [Bacteriovoracaceae bacterium]